MDADFGCSRNCYSIIDTWRLVIEKAALSVGPGFLRKSLRVVSFVKIERRKVLRRGSGWLEVVREAKLICRVRVDGSKPRGGG